MPGTWDSVAIGAMANLRELELRDNEIGDAGITALAQACASGAMANLTVLHLLQNKITDDGFATLFPLLTARRTRSGRGEI